MLFYSFLIIYYVNTINVTQDSGKEKTPFFSGLFFQGDHLKKGEKIQHNPVMVIAPKGSNPKDKLSL
jgi:hypothetical protein